MTPINIVKLKILTTVYWDKNQQHKINGVINKGFYEHSSYKYSKLYVLYQCLSIFEKILWRFQKNLYVGKEKNITPAFLLYKYVISNFYWCSFFLLIFCLNFYFLFLLIFSVLNYIYIFLFLIIFSVLTHIFYFYFLN